MKTLHKLKLLFVALLLAPLLALASEELHLDKAPDISGDNARLQNGAKLFVNYCMGCHSIGTIRYNKLTALGLTEQQIIDNLMFTTDKIGETMTTAMKHDEAKRWFGATPPDLSLVARARASESGSGPDWLYSYLRGFYRDPTRPTGWNNTVFDKVGMPHVFYELQGEQVLNEHHELTLVVPGTLSAAEYDTAVGDLVGFLTWVGEPQVKLRQKLGVAVLIFLAVFGVFAYMLKKEYWKDVH